MDHGSGTLLEHRAQLALAEVDAGVTGLAESNLWSMSDADLLELRVAQERTLARLQSTLLAATREIDARGAAVATGASSTAGWLRGRLLLHPGAAKAEVALARDLDGEMAATGAALAGGHITRDQAAAVALSVHRLPRGVDAQTRDEAQAFLLEKAEEFDPAALHNLGRHLILRLDPEGGEALERDEARQHDRQDFTLVHHHDGSWSTHGQFAPEGGAFLDTALGAVSKPRPAADGTPDPRPAAQRRAEGLLDLVRLAAGAPDMPESGGEPVTLVVTTPLDNLKTAHPDHDPDVECAGHGCGRVEKLHGCGDTDAAVIGDTDADVIGNTDPDVIGDTDAEVFGDAVADDAGGAATFEDGSPLSPEAARRLGCDAWLVAAIIASGREILDIGRMTRNVPRGIRRALIVRDGGCAFPGCGRPPRWCQAHHIWHWADGGPTALTNLVLLCGRHHRVIHHDGWDVWLDRSGRAVFRPPRWIDPDQVLRAAWRPPTLHGLPART